MKLFMECFLCTFLFYTSDLTVSLSSRLSYYDLTRVGWCACRRYRVLYNYKPQNEDELELVEGETVYVMEKCDDGWYVGSSQRTGYLGTFPGNYVERQV